MPHKKKLTNSLSVSVQLIERRIYLIRGQKVMIDADLAELYDVPTKRLNQQVQRNKDRFRKTSCPWLVKVPLIDLRTSRARKSRNLVFRLAANVKYHSARP